MARTTGSHLQTQKERLPMQGLPAKVPVKKVAVQKTPDVVEYAVVIDEETWCLAKRKAEGVGIDVPSLFRYFARYCDYTRNK